MEKRIIYYEDELNDEFSEAQIETKVIDEHYDYSNRGFSKVFLHILIYRMIARPIAFLFLKLKFRHKIIGKEKLKPNKKRGFYLYGNHTNDIADALIPSMISYPKDVYVIVHPNNVSMPVLGKITPYLGAVPLPGDRISTKNFMETINERIAQKHVVGIYPEAHIWPYYTKIRPFTDLSFRYPATSNTPVYCFTNTYQKRKYSKTPRIVTYVDGPFYAREDATNREKKKQLRELVYEAMVERSKNNNVTLIEYRKKEG